MPACQRIILCIARGTKNLTASRRNSEFRQVFKIHIGFLQIRSIYINIKHAIETDVIASLVEDKPQFVQSRVPPGFFPYDGGRSSLPRDRKLSCRRPPTKFLSFKRWQPFNSLSTATLRIHTAGAFGHHAVIRVPRCFLSLRFLSLPFYRLAPLLLCFLLLAPFSSSRRCRSSLIMSAIPCFPFQILQTVNHSALIRRPETVLENLI